ncbi:hypothetical protein SAMN04488074_10594 [Lentzea albidocapillata subsp. violacea]|uniref:Uncharacterized protein n=1 Tax=Lentzea albidocapillata subsp. violacea TaxID=128104 RepID=A0A1G9AR40_9PSEU|nr:hypothetical protein [Lentzea albidocapillata]SDK29733.1 hypothetical protein SAMN04488074_10594 [Lentzea albidocapillata subsp. violacea]
MSELPPGQGEEEVDVRLLVHSSTDDDGEPVLSPWLSLKNDNPPKR